MTIIDLTKMKEEETGVIKEIHGAEDFAGRIEAMGIRPGKKIKKITSSFLGGPQTIEIDTVKVAIGFGMAKKILIEVDR